jgi:hypothetical protein
MPFQLFKRRSKVTSTQPTIGVQHRGTMSLNSAAFELFVSVGRIEDRSNVFTQFLYDPETRTVALRPVPPETRDSYPVRKQPASESYLVTGRGFVAFFGIDAKDVRRYTVRVIEGNMIGFSLTDEGAAATEDDSPGGPAGS